MFVAGGVEREMLEKFKRGPLGGRNQHSEGALAVFTQSERWRQKICADVLDSTKPRQAFEPAWKPVAASTEKVNWGGIAQREEVRET